MGQEERARQISQAQARAAMERMVGDPKPYGTHENGCPKCGTPRYVNKAATPDPVLCHETRYCWGYQKLVDDEAQPCRTQGQHFHVTCGMCGHFWLTRCKDWKPSDDAPMIEAP